MAAAELKQKLCFSTQYLKRSINTCSRSSKSFVDNVLNGLQSLMEWVFIKHDNSLPQNRVKCHEIADILGGSRGIGGATTPQMVIQKNTPQSPALDPPLTDIYPMTIRVLKKIGASILRRHRSTPTSLLTLANSSFSSLT